MTLKNVYTCRLARLQLAQWDIYESTVNDFFASVGSDLTQIDTQIDFVVRQFENQ